MNYFFIIVEQAPGEGKAQENQNGQLVPFLGDVGSHEVDNRFLSRERIQGPLYFKSSCEDYLGITILRCYGTTPLDEQGRNYPEAVTPVIRVFLGRPPCGDRQVPTL